MQGLLRCLSPTCESTVGQWFPRDGFRGAPRLSLTLSHRLCFPHPSSMSSQKASCIILSGLFSRPQRLIACFQLGKGVKQQQQMSSVSRHEATRCKDKTRQDKTRQDKTRQQAVQELSRTRCRPDLSPDLAFYGSGTTTGNLEGCRRLRACAAGPSGGRTRCWRAQRARTRSSALRPQPWPHT